jgi:general secretion pathway protein D
VSDTASRDLGVNWQVAGTSSYGSDGTIGAGISSGVTPSPLGLTADTLGAAVGSTLGAAPGLIGGAVGIGENAANFAFTINALERRGQADTLSEPSVLALNNQVAVIDITRDVGYVSDFENRAVSSGGVSGTGNTTNVLQQQVLVPRYETEQEFIRLNVRPSVARNSDIITLTVSPQVRELSGFVGDTQFNSVSPGTTVLGSTPINQPLFTERQMSSTVHIKNNQFIVLGGLVQERDQINEEGIPGLIDLGLARRLFGTEGKSLERRKLLVVVMVHMIDPSGAEYDDIQEYVLDNARAALPSYIRRQERERLLLENRRAAIKASELNDERRTREQQLNAPSGKSGRDGGSDGL